MHIYPIGNLKEKLRDGSLYFKKHLAVSLKNKVKSSKKNNDFITCFC